MSRNRLLTVVAPACSLAAAPPRARFRALTRAVAFVFVSAGVLRAQGPAAAQKLPPIRPLGAVEQKSAELFGAVSAVRALPGGRVLMNDISGRRLMMFEPSLATYVVVADTSSATANAYSSRAAGLLAYRGDSSLFVDPTSLSMMVIDGKGQIARVMAVPRPNDAGALIGNAGAPGFDAKGRLVYRAPPQFRFTPPAPGQPFAPPAIPDSMAVVRLELATRKMDTIAFVKTTKVLMNMTQDANGRVRMSTTINPMQLVDDWAVLSDGSVAVIRARDYHVDWTHADGSQSSTGKTPFAWRHLDDSAKIAFIDSTKVAMEKIRAQAVAEREAARASGTQVAGAQGLGGGALGGAIGGAGMTMEFRMAGPGGGGDGPRSGGGGEGPRPSGGPAFNLGALPPLQFVSPSELPDYAPPFTAGSARGDMDGNLWVRTSNVVNGGSVYDVINGRGDLVDRIQVPAGRVIAGFGAGGVVYMGVREDKGVRLEQARRKPGATPVTTP